MAELPETSVASVNSALQRARDARDEQRERGRDEVSLDEVDQELLARYVDAFQRYDMEALTALIHEDATQSMPPFDMWPSGRDDILHRGSGRARLPRLAGDPTVAANGAPAFGQYKPSESGDGYEPWALQVLELSEGRIVEFTFFLDTETVFPRFGLLLRLDGSTPSSPIKASRRAARGTRASRTCRPVRRATSWKRASASTVAASGWMIEPTSQTIGPGSAGDSRTLFWSAGLDLGAAENSSRFDR